MKTFILISKEVRGSIWRHKRMLNYLVRKELYRHFLKSNTSGYFDTHEL